MVIGQLPFHALDDHSYANTFIKTNSQATTRVGLMRCMNHYTTFGIPSKLTRYNLLAKLNLEVNCHARDPHPAGFRQCF